MGILKVATVKHAEMNGNIRKEYAWRAKENIGSQTLMPELGKSLWTIPNLDKRGCGQTRKEIRKRHASIEEDVIAAAQGFKDYTKKSKDKLQ